LDENIHLFTPEDSIVHRNSDPVFSPTDAYVSTSDLSIFDSSTGISIDVGPFDGRLTAWSPDSTILCLASDEYVTIWNTTTWQFEAMIVLDRPGSGSEFLVHDLDWKEDTIVVLQNDGWVTIIDAISWDATQMSIGSHSYTTVSLSPNTTLIAAAFGSKVDLIKTSDGQLDRSLASGTGRSLTLEWSRNGSILYNIKDRTLAFWYTSNWTGRSKFFTSNDGAIDDVNQLFYSIWDSGRIEVHSLPDLTYERSFDPGIENSEHIAVSHNGTLLFLLGDGMAMIHVPSGNTIFTRLRSTVGSSVSAFSSQYVAFGSWHRIEIWDLQMRTRYNIIEPISFADNNFLTYLAFSSDGAFLAHGTSHGMLRIHNMSSKLDEATFMSSSRFQHIVWHPTEHLVASIDYDGLIRFYDHDKDEFPTRIQGVRAYNQFARWSPDGKVFCYGQSPSKQLVFIDYESRDTLKVLNDWNGVPTGDFSPDGSYFIYPGKDNSPIIIDTTTWTVVSTLTDVDYTKGLQWGPTNHSIIVNSLKGIELWWVSNFSKVGMIHQIGPLAQFGDDELEILSLARDVVKFKAPYSFLELIVPGKIEEDKEIDLSINVVGSNYPLTYQWNLGDGNTSEGDAVRHTWIEPGSYTISVTAHHDRGFSVTVKRMVIIYDRTTPVAIIIGPDDVDEDDPIPFSGTSSTDNVGIFGYIWAFEDSIFYHTASVVHTFSEPGTYNVSLSVYDEAYHYNGSTIVVMVHDVTPPIADFRCPSVIPEDTIIDLTGSFSTDNTGIINYEWTISDGRTINNANISIAFESPGTYTIRLNVSDAEFNEAWKEWEVIVSDRTSPVIDLFISEVRGEDVPILFDATNSTDEGNGNLLFNWTFPGYENFNTPTVEHVFEDPGLYYIHLNITDGAGNSNATDIEVNVRDVTPPHAIVDPLVRRVSEDVSVPFEGSLSWDNVGIANYLWVFEQGVTSSDDNATHVFEEPGVHLVNFTVTDPSGLTNTTTIEVTVLDTTPPVLIVSPNGTIRLEEGSSGHSRIVLDASYSYDNVGIEEINWELDGEVVLSDVPTFDRELSPGEYVITVVITDGSGSSSSEIIEITVVAMDESEGPVSYYLALVVLIVVSIVIILVLFYRKRIE